MSLYVRPAGETGTPVTLVEHGEYYITAIAFSPSGDRVAAADSRHRVRIWPADGTSQPLVLQWPGGADWEQGTGVSSVAFSPSGDRVVAGRTDHKVRVWRLAGAEIQRIIRAAVSGCLDPDFQQRDFGRPMEEARKAYEACLEERGRAYTEEGVSSATAPQSPGAGALATDEREAAQTTTGPAEPDADELQPAAEEAVPDAFEDDAAADGAAFDMAGEAPAVSLSSQLLGSWSGTNPDTGGPWTLTFEAGGLLREYDAPSQAYFERTWALDGNQLTIGGQVVGPVRIEGNLLTIEGQPVMTFTKI